MNPARPFNPSKAQLEDWGYRHDPDRPSLPQQSYVEKEHMRRTMTDQLNFNADRLELLEKGIEALQEQLIPYMLEGTGEDPFVKDDLVEKNSAMMERLIQESSRINMCIRKLDLIMGRLQL